MDPLSQATLGAMGAQLKYSKKDLLKISIWGAIAGMAADLDILIKSSSDPLLNIQYHRQFSHSLIFIPIGALIVSLFLKLFKVPIKKSYPYTLLGYGTHGFLDAFTSYGTQLWWPFSTKREAWGCVSVIDPLVTAPLLILLCLGFKYKKRIFSILGWTYFCFYMTYGYFQRTRVENLLVSKKLLDSSNERYIIKPTLGNNFIWRVIIERGEEFKFLGVRLGLLSKDKVVIGKSVKKVFDIELLNLVNGNNLQVSDYKRFKFFTGNYLFWVDDNTIADARYSFLPHGDWPIWSLKFSRDSQDKHAEFIVDRKVTPKIKSALKNYWSGNNL
ncbi:MAG: hypothetical protein BM556_00860 [Bacteriovorax sp. MedPE-SWde]|nr:MAG: hypothetical protein BM556_00860 [Bacteriovorax sp. MedPE-SWde]